MESSAIDLSRFASTLFSDDSPLGDYGQRLLREPLSDRRGRAVQGDRWLMTLGWRLSEDIRGDVYLHHAGVTNGARSILAVWPEAGLAVALLSNASWTGRMEDTAVAFALATQSESVDCDDFGRHEIHGQFRDVPITGSMSWQESVSSCRALLQGDNELSEWLGRFNYGNAGAQALIRLDGEHWGLVTSIGISVLNRKEAHFDGLVGSSPLVMISSP